MEKAKLIIPLLIPFIALVAWAAKIDANVKDLEKSQDVLQRVDLRLYRIELKLGIEN